jgi:hypothetical protein
MVWKKMAEADNDTAQLFANAASFIRPRPAEVEF